MGEIGEEEKIECELKQNHVGSGDSAESKGVFGTQWG